MRAALERVGRPVVDYSDGDPGVQTLCPLCARGLVLWTEQHGRWFCDQPDCPGREDSSRIAYALEDEGPGGFANGNGNGHQNGVVVVPDPRETHHHPPRRPTGTRAGFTPRTR